MHVMTWYAPTGMQGSNTKLRWTQFKGVRYVWIAQTEDFGAAIAGSDEDRKDAKMPSRLGQAMYEWTSEISGLRRTPLCYVCRRGQAGDIDAMYVWGKKGEPNRGIYNLV